jgi:hypothetical protein
LRAKIREYLASKYKTFTVHKVMRIIDGFPSIDAFCAANKGEWLAKYHAARPKSHQDLGVVCMKALDAVIAFVREDRRNAELDRQAEERAKLEAKAAEEEARRKAEEEEERRNPKFTLAQMKAIVSFMELCEVQELDLKAFRAFLKSINVEMVKKA